MADINDTSSKPLSGDLSAKIAGMNAERRNHTPVPEPEPNGKPSKRLPAWAWAVICIAVLALIVAAAWFFTRPDAEQKPQAQAAAVQDNDDLNRQLVEKDLENLEMQLENFEYKSDIVVEDSIKLRLSQQYEAARLQVEDLKRQLRETDSRNTAEINRLKGEIESLRALLKHYIEEIDRLNKENEELRSENDELRRNNADLSGSLARAEEDNVRKSETIRLASKLNVSGVSLSLLNKKDKSTSKIKDARKFAISFAIQQNNTAETGAKEIYAVIWTPEGSMLDGDGGRFAFEGSTIPASARLGVQYGGEEIGGLTMYCDVNTALSAGTYRVQLFCDGYALCDQKSFSFK